MTTNARAAAAYQLAVDGKGDDSPEIEYAVRRVGGPEKVKGHLFEFTQAFNDAPVVDADLDTRDPGETLVRPLEPKDGIR